MEEITFSEAEQVKMPGPHQMMRCGTLLIEVITKDGGPFIQLIPITMLNQRRTGAFVEFPLARLDEVISELQIARHKHTLTGNL